MRSAKRLKLVLVGTATILAAFALQTIFVPPKLRNPGEKFAENRSSRQYALYTFDGDFNEALAAIKEVYPPPKDHKVTDVYSHYIEDGYQSGRYFVRTTYFSDGRSDAQVCVVSTSILQLLLNEYGEWSAFEPCPEAERGTRFEPADRVR